MRCMLGHSKWGSASLLSYAALFPLHLLSSVQTNSRSFSFCCCAGCVCLCAARCIRPSPVWCGGQRNNTHGRAAELAPASGVAGKSWLCWCALDWCARPPI